MWAESAVYAETRNQNAYGALHPYPRWVSITRGQNVWPRATPT